MALPAVERDKCQGKKICIHILRTFVIGIAPSKLPGRRSTPNATSSSVSTSNALTSQSHAVSTSDRSIAAQTAQAQAASTMSFVQQQQQVFSTELNLWQLKSEKAGAYTKMNV